MSWWIATVARFAAFMTVALLIWVIVRIIRENRGRRRAADDEARRARSPEARAADALEQRIAEKARRPD